MINNLNNSRRQSRGGYIALVALLIVAATGLTIGITISLIGIDELQLSYGGSRAANAKAVASACLEDGLGRLRKSWVNYSGSLSIGSDSCIINAVVSGSLATLTATGNSDIYQQRIQTQVDNNLEIVSWQEN
jgi:hypothetical protein